MSNLLFSSIELDGVRLSNRIVIAPMCQYSAQNGLAGNWHLMHYGALSHSGAGLLIMEATAILREGRITPFDLGLWSDETEQALARVVAGIRQYSTIPLCLQLGHAGRKASQSAPWMQAGVLPTELGGWQPEAPSPLAYMHGEAGGVVPRELDAMECLGIRDAFVEAAVRADRIGFEVIEIHMAHGYLLHEFLSPISNVRKDVYGGSLESRMRFPVEVFESIREAIPLEKAVGVRISGSDWVEGGWTVEESCILAGELQKRGCAYIHVSGGGLSPEQDIKAGPGYQADMAARIRSYLALSGASDRASPMPVIAVGLITEPVQAESLLRSGQADLVALGRGILYNPRWPWHAAQVLGASVTAPPQYWRSAPYGTRGLFKQ